MANRSGVVLAGARKNNSRAKGTRGILLSRDDEKRDESREKRILDWSWWTIGRTKDTGSPRSVEKGIALSATGS